MASAAATRLPSDRELDVAEEVLCLAKALVSHCTPWG